MYVEISNVTKSYGEGGSYCKVLNGISTLIDRGQICVFRPSGSGKSTSECHRRSRYRRQRANSYRWERNHRPEAGKAVRLPAGIPWGFVFQFII